MSPRGTVYDRMKRTGYMMGPNHSMGPAVDRPPAVPPPAEPGGEEEAGGSPPNLRDAGGEADSCGTCVHFDSNHCEKFDVDLTPNLLCDAYEEGAGPDESETPNEAADEARTPVSM